MGKIVALLAEEGDDISNLQPPADAPHVTKKQPEPPEPASRPTPSAEPRTTPSPSHSPKHVEHSRPLFPSVLRLLQTYDVPNLEKIKGTGVRGMLTKGDILAHLGMASSPTGTYKETKTIEQVSPPKEKEVKVNIIYDFSTPYVNFIFSSLLMDLPSEDLSSLISLGLQFVHGLLQVLLH